MAKKHTRRSREKIAARAASLAPSRELLNRLGETFRPLQEEAWLDYCARQAEMDAQREETMELPLAAAPPEKEKIIENLEDINLHLSYGGVEYDFEGYLASLSGREVVVWFTEIRGGDEDAESIVVQFTIPEQGLFSSPFSIQFLKANPGRRFSLGLLSGHERFDLREIRQSLQVQPIERASDDGSGDRAT